MAKTKNQKGEVKPLNTTDDAVNGELTEEQLAAARVEMRASMKEKFGTWIEVFDEDAVQEDIDNARKDFETRVEEWKNKTFTLAPADKAIETVKLLKDWNTNLNHWSAGAWRGVVMFDNVCEKELKAQAENPTDLVVDYQTLIFLHHSMKDPKGTGIADAKLMSEYENYDLENGKIREDSTVTYSSILSDLYKLVNELALADKMLNLWRERITIAAAGIKFNFKITELEEFKELHDAWVVSDENINK